MEIFVAVAVIAVVALLMLAWFVTKRLGARKASRQIHREKLGSVADGHREMADAHVSSVEDLVPQAEGHREAAADHERIADELEARIEREQRHAQFHAERADETEHERERI